MAPDEKYIVTKGQLWQWDHQLHRGSVQGSVFIWLLHCFSFLPAGESFPFPFPLSLFPFLIFPKSNFHFWSQCMSSSTAHTNKSLCFSPCLNILSATRLWGSTAGSHWYERTLDSRHCREMETKVKARKKKALPYTSTLVLHRGQQLLLTFENTSLSGKDTTLGLSFI